MSRLCWEKGFWDGIELEFLIIGIGVLVWRWVVSC
jgi:hypothetical protein